jgi:hypothetical protein
MADLFLDNYPELTKKAGFSARLSETAENWAQEAASELLKQFPFFSDYEVSPTMDRVEAQRGYGFGYLDVSNRTERPEIEHEEAGLPHVRIPLVVEERQMRPFTIFMDGERVLPLNEDRIRETLFNPNTFDLSTVQPTDPNLTDNLSPPNRSGTAVGEKTASAKTKEAFAHITPEQWQAMYKNPKIEQMIQKYGRFDHPEVDNAVFEIAAKRYGYHPKTASVDTSGLKELAKKKVEGVKAVATYGWKKKESGSKPSLLQAIAPTISEKDRESFVEKLSSNKSLQVGFRKVAGLLVDVFDKTKRASADERLQAVIENIHPTVVTVQRLPGGDFLVKSANVNAFAGGPEAKGKVVPEQEVAAAVGPGNAAAMKPGQTATATADPVENTEPEAAFDGQPVQEFGQYTVQDTMGNSLMGWVIPELLSWDGNFSPMPVQLFTNGSAYAMQDSIAGKLVGKGAGLPVDEPRGEGVFYEINNDGAIATAPVTVNSAMAGPDGSPVYRAVDTFGNQLTLRKVEGLATPERISNQEFAVPATWNFMRVNNQTQLAGQTGKAKAASVREDKNSIVLFYNGAFQFDGGCGLHKIASELRQDLDAMSAEFLLGLLGVDGPKAKQKVAEARKRGAVKLAGLKTINLLADRYHESMKTASALISKMPALKQDLVKEAAALGDEGTVDKVLALNFINPDNVATFIEYLPELQGTSEKLAEMLIHSYLGMEDLPESAIERAMKGMEEVVSGLKAMQQSQEG